MRKEELIRPFYCNENYIFHYTKFDTSLKIIISNELLMSSLSKMNDPLEFLDFSDCTLYDGTIKTQDMINKEKEISYAKQRRKNVVRQLSFVQSMGLEKDTQQELYNNCLHQGWARNRMWAQYADNHSGVCLVFDKTKCIDAAKELPNSKIYDGKILYSNNFTPFENVMSIDIQEKDLNKDYRDYYLSEDKVKWYFQKCEDYAAENEYRILSFNYDFDSEANVCKFNYHDALIGVILGTKNQNVEIELMKKLLIDKQISLYWTTWRTGVPDLIEIMNGEKN